MRRRSAPVNVGFLVLWMVFWTAAILVAIWHMGGAAWHGEVAPALFLVVWVVAAGFGLLSAARQLVRLLLEGRSPPKPVRNHELGRRLRDAAEFRGSAGGRARRRRRAVSLAGVVSGHPFRGPLFMATATCAYVINDAMMKIATEGLPPYQVLVLRGLWATAWGLPLVLALGHGRRLGMMFERRVVVRNLAELGAILCYIVALANMQIADVISIGQITPLIVILGAAFLLGEPVGGLRLALIACGFLGALMVAQPTGGGVTFFAVLALGNAVGAAVRDLVGRKVRPDDPGLVVALSASVIVLAGAAAAHLLFEEWVAPDGRTLMLLGGSGLFLCHRALLHLHGLPDRADAPGGAVLLFLLGLGGDRRGAGLRARSRTRWRCAGIALVIASGLAVVLLDQRRPRPSPVA